jgi:hypothetical protein
MKTQSIDNSMDVIDSRDVIERIEELENDLQSLINAVDEDTADTEAHASAITALCEWLETDDRDAAVNPFVELTIEEWLEKYGESEEARELRA